MRISILEKLPWREWKVSHKLREDTATHITIGLTGYNIQEAKMKHFNKEEESSIQKWAKDLNGASMEEKLKNPMNYWKDAQLY